MMNDLHDLAAAYVMDGLDAAERLEFERHLEECADCQADVVRLGEPVGAIAEALATPPSPAMREAVLSQIAVTPQLHGSSNVVPFAPRLNRAVTFALGVAAVVLAVVAGVALFQLRDAREFQNIVTAPDVETVVLAGDGIEARFTYSVARGQGVFVSDSLPAVSAELSYQLWLIDTAGATPAGLFSPEDGPLVVGVLDVREGTSLGVTVEPAGGSASPTGDVLLEAPLRG